MKSLITCVLAIVLFSTFNSITAKEEMKTADSTINAVAAHNRSRDDWWQQLKWPESLCPVQTSWDSSGINLYKMADGRELVKIICFLGAYQGQQIYYLRTPDKDFTLLEFDQFESPDIGVLEPYRTAELTGASQLTAANSQLKVFRKYRGIGDCGQLLTYDLNKTQPELVEFRMRDCEDGQAYIPPEKWRKIPIKSLPKLKKTK